MSALPPFAELPEERLRSALWRYGLLSGALYLVAFALPFSVVRHAHRLADLGDLVGHRPLPALAVFLALLLLVALYLRAWLACLRYRAESQEPLILSFTGAFLLILAFTYPFSSSDVYTYFLYGRIYALQQLNPLVALPGRMAGDPFAAFDAGWADAAAPYGPAWIALSGAVSIVAGSHLLVGLLIFKAIAAGAALLSAFFLARLLEHFAPQWKNPGLLFFAWNPLVLFETAANGHNDALTLLLVLAALWLLVTQRSAVLSAAAFVSALLLKAIALPLVPAYALLLCKRLHPTCRWRHLLTVAALTIVAGAAAYLPFGGIWVALQAFLDQLFVINVSLVGGLQWLLHQLLGSSNGNWQTATRIALAIGGLGFLGTAAWLLARAEKTPSGLLRASFWSFFFLLALFWPQFHPWYLLWPLALVVLVPSLHAQARVLLFVLTALIGFSFSPLWPWQQFDWEATPLPTLAALLVFLPPLLLPSQWLRRLLGLSPAALEPASGP